MKVLEDYRRDVVAHRAEHQDKLVNEGDPRGIYGRLSTCGRRGFEVKRLIVGVLAALTIGLTMAPVAGADPITPDEWGMDDGVGVGTRTAGTPCLASEAHHWAEDPADGRRYALWCPPPAFVWIPVVAS